MITEPQTSTPPEMEEEQYALDNRDYEVQLERYEMEREERMES